MPKEDIDTILNDTDHAPTAYGKDEYDVSVIVKEEEKIKAAKACMDQSWISNVFYFYLIGLCFICFFNN